MILSLSVSVIILVAINVIFAVIIIAAVIGKYKKSSSLSSASATNESSQEHANEELYVYNDLVENPAQLQSNVAYAALSKNSLS